MESRELSLNMVTQKIHDLCNLTGWFPLSPYPLSTTYIHPLTGIFYLLAGYGLWNHKSWGWFLYLISELFSIVFSILRLNLFNLFLHFCIIFYLATPIVREFFGNPVKKFGLSQLALPWVYLALESRYLQDQTELP